MLDLHTNETQSSRVLVINLKGSLDTSSSNDFYAYISGKLKEGYSKFIVSCEELNYISSSGISIILRIKASLEKYNASLIYAQINKEIKLLFRFFGLDKKLLIAENKSSARKMLDDIIEKELKNTSNFKVSEPASIAFSKKTDSISIPSTEPGFEALSGEAERKPKEKIKLKNEDDGVYVVITEPILDTYSEEPIDTPFIENESVVELIEEDSVELEKSIRKTDDIEDNPPEIEEFEEEIDDNLEIYSTETIQGNLKNRALLIEDESEEDEEGVLDALELSETDGESEDDEDFGLEDIYEEDLEDIYSDDLFVHNVEEKARDLKYLEEE
ncbi:MAG: STAS domain-containing protein, partial [Leptospiraceae bacterium]|nr:STAS domain-containing protein [Leptospiraceae bacterium]